MWYIALGEFNADAGMFSIRGQKNFWTEFMLWFLFCLATFFVLIHMLNMLIAVMTETITGNLEVEEETRLKEHL